MSILIGLLPVLLFLVILNSMDVFKILNIKRILIVIAFGSVAALLSYLENNQLLGIFSDWTVTHLFAPIIEETLKFGFIIYLFYKNKIGFLSDALILGFAAGTGFSLVENIFYLNYLGSENIMIWIIRGFGTAIMHGATTGIVSIVAQTFISKYGSSVKYLLLALIPGIIIHSLFNFFIFTPFIQTVLQIVSLPIIIYFVFSKSESLLKEWMESQFESEFELLQKMKLGRIDDTRVGKYIMQIKDQFPAEVIFDMLAYIQLYTELSIKAKGLLLMKESGFPVEKDEELTNKLKELNYLSSHIGKTGMRTLFPVINIKNIDLWKLEWLKE